MLWNILPFFFFIILLDKKNKSKKEDEENEDEVDGKSKVRVKILKNLNGYLHKC